MVAKAIISYRSRASALGYHINCWHTGIPGRYVRQFTRGFRFEFKPGYRACLIQTGHKLSLNLNSDASLVRKRTSSVPSAANV